MLFALSKFDYRHNAQLSMNKNVFSETSCFFKKSSIQFRQKVSSKP